MNTLEDNFTALLNDLADTLTPVDVEQIRELVDVGELTIAFENFCTQLYERSARCSQEHVERIAAIGTAMGVRCEYWQDI